MTKKSVSELQNEYTVLARKYRPKTFDDLIGQETLVRTLINAIKTGRVAHAFVLTGVRGVGKTTTARIIARVLNCIGIENEKEPIISPCGVCENCVAISEDRHVDVLEMDAASRTGVDDIRELIESVRYRPTTARYKVYIIDEVHMLSKNAFNALLKTLEEPPDHVKFIFATTEIRKIPVTVLSRCQRFDLKRVSSDALSNYFKGIADYENVRITDEALGLISRAADGSVRDGLSLLDQAIAHGSGVIDDQQIREMLGLADRAKSFQLIDAVFKGDIASALALLEQLYKDGIDPACLVEDLLEITHWLTRIKILPIALDDAGVPEIERVNGKKMAQHLTMASLARAWQMLLKGLSEIRTAPSPVQATEMVLVRLAYASNLPTPEEAIKKLIKDEADSSAERPEKQATNILPSPNIKSSLNKVQPEAPSLKDHPISKHVAIEGVDKSHALQSIVQKDSFLELDSQLKENVSNPQTLMEVAELAGKEGKVLLRANIINNVRLVSFEMGCIEIALEKNAKKELPYEMAKFLSEVTARRWVVSVSNQVGDLTLQQQWDYDEAIEFEKAREDPLVKAVLGIFDGSYVKSIRVPNKN